MFQILHIPTATYVKIRYSKDIDTIDGRYLVHPAYEDSTRHLTPAIYSFKWEAQKELQVLINRYSSNELNLLPNFLPIVYKLIKEEFEIVEVDDV